MCTVSTLTFRACPHIISRATHLHENPIYCGDQRVIHEGEAQTEERCPGCTTSTQARLGRGDTGTCITSMDEELEKRRGSSESET